MSSAQHIPTVVQSLEPIITQYGYFAVGGLLTLEDFGLPVPGETVLIAAAFYAGLGQLNIFLVVIIAFLGAVVGDNIGFGIGQYGGHPLIERYGKYVFITHERLHRLEEFFNRNGGKVVVVARFIEGLRQLNGIIAGLSEMRWPRFIVFNMIGAALWVSVWSVAGYFGGSHIQTFLRYQMYFSIAAVLFALGFVALHWQKHRRKKTKP